MTPYDVIWHGGLQRADSGTHGELLSRDRPPTSWWPQMREAILCHASAPQHWQPSGNKRTPKIGQDQRAAMQRAYDSGLGTTQIAIRWGCSIQVARTICEAGRVHRTPRAVRGL